MNTNINDLVKKLPDYEDFMSVAEKLEALGKERAILEIQIKSSESNIVKTATTNPDYFQNGKAPSMSFIEATYKFSGFTDELLPLRRRFAELGVEVDRLKIQLDAYKTLLDIWRTLSANERKATF